MFVISNTVINLVNKSPHLSTRRESSIFWIQYPNPKCKRSATLTSPRIQTTIRARSKLLQYRWGQSNLISVAMNRCGVQQPARCQRILLSIRFGTDIYNTKNSLHSLDCSSNLAFDPSLLFGLKLLLLQSFFGFGTSRGGFAQGLGRGCACSTLGARAS